MFFFLSYAFFFHLSPSQNTAKLYGKRSWQQISPAVLFRLYCQIEFFALKLLEVPEKLSSRLIWKTFRTAGVLKRLHQLHKLSVKPPYFEGQRMLMTKDGAHSSISPKQMEHNAMLHGAGFWVNSRIRAYVVNPTFSTGSRARC